MTQRVPAPASPSSAFVDDYWNSLTDAELLLVPWLIDDPRTLAGIEAVIPDNLGEFQVEVEYQLDQGEQSVPCAHCPQHTPHRHGFVIKTPEGRRFLLGSVCGPKAYGSDYRVASNARRQAKKRYDALIKWHDYRHRLPDLIEALEEAGQDISFKAVRRARAQFHNNAAPLVGRLSRLRPNHMTGLIDIVVTTGIRDIAAEKVRDERFQAASALIVDLPNKQHRQAMKELHERYRPNEPIIDYQERDFGSLPPMGWLVGQDNPTKLLDDITARLRGYYAVGRETEGKKLALVESWSRATRKDLDLVIAALQNIRGAGAFFEPANLRRLVEWDKTNPSGSLGIVAEAGGLFLSANAEASINLGDGWAPPGDLFLELSA